MISHMTVKWSGLSVCVPITELIPFINIKNLLIAKCYWEEKEEGKVPSRANAGKNKLCVALLDSEDHNPRSALTGNFQYQLFSCLTGSQKQNNYKKCITDKKRGGCECECECVFSRWGREQGVCYCVSEVILIVVTSNSINGHVSDQLQWLTGFREPLSPPFSVTDIILVWKMSMAIGVNVG